MNVCRTTPRLVTTAPGDVYSLAVTPNSKKLVFSAGKTNNGNLERDVFSVNADGSDLRQLTDRPELSWQAAISPNGREIAYIVEKSGKSDVYAMRLDGSKDRPLTTSNAGFWEPVWAPESQMVLTTSRDTPRRNLELVGVRSNGTGQTLVSNMGGGSNEDAIFSRDGKKILFSSDIERGRSQLYVMNRDGSNIEKLSQGVTFMGPATVSPQGQAVFTGVDGGNNWNLYRVNIDGSGTQEKLPGGPLPTGVQFSPDGEQLVYTSEGKVILADADGNNAMAITTKEDNFKRPQFSPDGRSLFALTAVPDGTAIYEIPLDQ